MLLQKSDVHEGLKADLPKYEKYIHHFLPLLERNKTCQAKMSTGYQLQNCEKQTKVVNFTGNASPTSGGNKRLVKAILRSTLPFAAILCIFLDILNSYICQQNMSSLIAQIILPFC